MIDNFSEHDIYADMVTKARILTGLQLVIEWENDHEWHSGSSIIDLIQDLIAEECNYIALDPDGLIKGFINVPIRNRKGIWGEEDHPHFFAVARVKGMNHIKNYNIVKDNTYLDLKDLLLDCQIIEELEEETIALSQEKSIYQDLLFGNYLDLIDMMSYLLERAELVPIFSSKHNPFSQHFDNVIDLGEIDMDDMDDEFHKLIDYLVDMDDEESLNKATPQTLAPEDIGNFFNDIEDDTNINDNNKNDEPTFWSKLVDNIKGLGKKSPSKKLIITGYYPCREIHGDVDEALSNDDIFNEFMDEVNKVIQRYKTDKFNELKECDQLYTYIDKDGLVSFSSKPFLSEIGTDKYYTYDDAIIADIGVKKIEIGKKSSNLIFFKGESTF